jgi:serine/threonine-protein kinase
MAEVFRGKAVAGSGFEKPVAIKRILPELCRDARFVKLLIAEARVLSQLRHRSIVQVFDVGLDDDGQYFLVMEYVDGCDLATVQRRFAQAGARMPLDLALHIGAEVCEALEHAYTAIAPDGQPMRLVHRDVSPLSIVISHAGEVKITDFGIAKRAEEHTGHGTIRGRYAYMSPEQSRAQKLDARSDVFSVGIVLFELISGRGLFSSLSDLQALEAVRNARLPRLMELDPTLPPEVETLIATALAVEREQRFPSAGKMGTALRSLRYSLDEAASDPGTELSRIVSLPEGIHVADEDATVLGKGVRLDESKVIKLNTVDAFAGTDPAGSKIIEARELIDRFDEEDTASSPRLSETAATVAQERPWPPAPAEPLVLAQTLSGSLSARPPEYPAIASPVASPADATHPLAPGWISELTDRMDPPGPFPFEFVDDSSTHLASLHQDRQDVEHESTDRLDLDEQARGVSLGQPRRLLATLALPASLSPHRRLLSSIAAGLALAMVALLVSWCVRNEPAGDGAVTSKVPVDAGHAGPRGAGDAGAPVRQDAGATRPRPAGTPAQDAGVTRPRPAVTPDAGPAAKPVPTRATPKKRTKKKRSQR